MRVGEEREKSEIRGTNTIIRGGGQGTVAAGESKARGLRADEVRGITTREDLQQTVFRG